MKIEEHLTNAIEDCKFCLDLLKSKKAADKAMIKEKLPDLVKALQNSAAGLKRLAK